MNDPCRAFLPTPLQSWENLVYGGKDKHGKMQWYKHWKGQGFAAGEAPAAASFQERAESSDL